MRISVLIRRILAFFVDTIITFGVAAAFFFTEPQADHNLYFASIAGAVAWVIGYSLLKDCLCGRKSPGKFIFCLKIVNFTTGDTPAFTALIMRNLTSPLGVVEGIIALCNKGRCLGDIFAETKVVSRKD